MPEISNCPECGKPVRIPDSLEGKQVRCPSCSATFIAGGESQAGTSPPMSRPPYDDPPPRRYDQAPPRRFDEPSPYEDDRDNEYDRPRRRRRDDYMKPARGGSVLTFGILAIVFALCCAFVGVIFGIVAWTMGASDLREIAAGRMDPEGEGQSRGGMVCGIIGTILGAINMVLGAVMFMGGGFPR